MDGLHLQHLLSSDGQRELSSLHNDLPEDVVQICIHLDIILCSFISENPLMVWNLSTVQRLKTIVISRDNLESGLISRSALFENPSVSTKSTEIVHTY
jgi:hypothetical protein